MNFQHILVEGLIATAPEEHKGQLFQLISDLQARLSPVEPHVAILALMKVHLDVEERLQASPLHQSATKGH
mgnify:CR=1 FL=1